MERLEELAAHITRDGGACLPIAMDVRDAQHVQKAVDSLPSDWKEVDVLVNNAGLALGREGVHEGNIDDWTIMIDTNIKGVLHVSRAVLPLMLPRRKGDIINIGSIAAKEVYKGGSVYNATKFAVDALTKGMRIDLLQYGIRVTGIHPGKVDTEFSSVRFKGDTAHAEAEYRDYEPLHAEDVADTILYAVTRPAHVCINDLLVMPTAQANTVHLHRQA